MKINDPSRPAGVKNSPRRAATEKTKAASAAKASGDAMSVMGVPDAELTPSVRAALTSLMEDVRDLRAELEQARSRIGELESLADRDPLLDIFNRRAFARELNRVFGLIDRYQMKASLVIVDLNDLKKINDERGHAAGDAALAHVAGMLTGHVRQADIVARLGGDEFALLLLQADQAGAAAKAQSIAAMVEAAPVKWEGEPFYVSLSWGVAEIHDGVSAQDAMKLADEAMYEAKNTR